MPELPDDSIPLMATDPPFGIGFMNKKWDKFDRGKQTKSQVVSWMRTTMKKDTRGMVGFFTPIWKEVLRVLKPGAFAFVMCIPRQDCLSRMIVSLEDAGFDVGFTPIFHAFAAGFPKAMSISKVVDKRLGAKRKVIGHGQKGRNLTRPKGHAGDMVIDELHQKPISPEITMASSPQAQALDGSYAGFQPKPAVEVVIVAMKPLSEKSYVDQALKNKKGITWLDDCKIPYEKQDNIIAKNPHTASKGSEAYNNICYGKYNPTSGYNPVDSSGRFPANLLVSDDALNDGKSGHSVGHYSYQLKKSPYEGGWKSLKDKGNLKENNNSFSRYFSLDAWFEKKFKELPKNVQKTFPFLIVSKASKAEKNKGCENLFWEKDSSSFGYHQIDGQRWMQLGREEEKIYKKTGKRISLRARGNIHPTVKPLKLFCYLITLGSREGDVVLDPFFGSGTTGVAARMLGRHYVGWETGPENVKIAKARLSTVESMLF